MRDTDAGLVDYIPIGENNGLERLIESTESAELRFPMARTQIGRCRATVWMDSTKQGAQKALDIHSPKVQMAESNKLTTPTRVRTLVVLIKVKMI